MVSKRLPNGSDPTAVAPDDPGSLDIVDEFQSNGSGNTKCSDTLQQSALKDLPSSLLNSITSTKVEYRHVGSSGLRVSNPILGTLGFGDKAWMDWVIGENEATMILDAAYRSGINTWDTANAYSNGQTESIIGRAIKKLNIPRRKLVLMTKVGRIVADTEHGPSSDFVAFLDDSVKRSKDYANQYGLSRTAILTAVEQSLERLQTSYIDVLHIHRWDDRTPIEETMSTLHHLVCTGKVRYLAASSMWTFQLARLQHVAEVNGWTKIVAMQSHYNLIYREEEREMTKFCKMAGIGLLAWAPLAEGYLARPFGASGKTRRSSKGPRFNYGTSDADKEIIKRVERLASRHKVAMSHIALAWLGTRVDSVIIGINSLPYMEELLEAQGLRLTAAEDALLSEPYVPKDVQGHS
ncbi:Aldo/keto reductase [Moelleriella libera RCEF 2490]|uniref:Aldo/keto reductase n=1 Tax=Moelleriella libera RCEF 2490 TaxID=1081109 RepID=A0A167YTC0_9HYPO|nr:Aldo/keto reductase [Moelleriella libera RCEF 2490]